MSDDKNNSNGGLAPATFPNSRLLKPGRPTLKFGGKLETAFRHIMFQIDDQHPESMFEREVTLFHLKFMEHLGSAKNLKQVMDALPWLRLILNIREMERGQMAIAAFHHDREVRERSTVFITKGEVEAAEKGEVVDTEVDNEDLD